MSYPLCNIRYENGLCYLRTQRTPLSLTMRRDGSVSIAFKSLPRADWNDLWINVYFESSAGATLHPETYIPIVFLLRDASSVLEQLGLSTACKAYQNGNRSLGS